MRTVLALMNRNRKLFFKDKGMLFTSMITPVILIVLYATFLAKVFKDSFTAAIPDMITISDKLINGTVAAQLTASLMAVSCITVAVDADIHSFIDLLGQEPFDQHSLKRYGLKNVDVVEVLKQVFG